MMGRSSRYEDDDRDRETGISTPYYLNEFSRWSTSATSIKATIEKSCKDGIVPKALVIINPRRPSRRSKSQTTVIKLCEEHSHNILANEVYQANLHQCQTHPYLIQKGHVANTVPSSPSSLSPKASRANVVAEASISSARTFLQRSLHSSIKPPNPQAETGSPTNGPILQRHTEGLWQGGLYFGGVMWDTGQERVPQMLHSRDEGFHATHKGFE